VVGSSKHSNGLSGSMKGRELLDHQSDYFPDRTLLYVVT
jgi:hypothetical protein